MPNTMGRRFNDEEVALIIKRAAELQSQQADEQRPGTSLTLAEVEQIAREAGIEPRLVRRAAQGLDHLPETTNRANPWMGAPTTLVFESVIDGEITRDHYEGLVNEMRRTFADNGVPSVLGRTLAWTTLQTGRKQSGGGRDIDISVISRSGVTTIRIEEELRNLGLGLFIGMMAGGGAGLSPAAGAGAMALAGSAMVGGAAAVFVVGGFYALSRGIYAHITSKRERQLRELLSRLSNQVREAVEADAARLTGGTPRMPDLLSSGDSFSF